MLTSAARKRFEACLVLAKRGATAGERASALAAAERLATAAGMTLAEAKAPPHRLHVVAQSDVIPGTYPHRAARTYRAKRKPRPGKPPTVADRIREKAEMEVDRRRRCEAADRALMKDLAEQAVYEAEQRRLQAERDRQWAAERANRK